MKIILITFLVLLSCKPEKTIPISLSSQYVKENKKQLGLYEEEIKRLKNKKAYLKDLEYQKRVERAERFYSEANEEFKELVKDQNFENKREYEQELDNYKVVWTYLVTNYSI